METLKLVEYEKYCSKCKHRNLGEHESPCDECLEIGAREFSHKPLYFEKGARSRGRREKETRESS